MTNTRRLVCPTRSMPPPSLGTNPISVTAPTKTDPWCLDMATSTVPIGKVELYKRLEKKIPLGWGVDGTGALSDDPTAVLEQGGLAPLGGAEETRGYKGYGLAAMVEMFCGVLSGGKWGQQLGPWRKPSQGGERPAGLSHCFAAIDPHAFNPDFEEGMQGFADSLRALPVVDPQKPVLTAGDPELLKARQQAKLVVYDAKVVAALRQFAVPLGVPLPDFFPVVA
eukprot:TRINITY_DN3911_c0_g1_i4.p1 TRINITY_DN3911_c0_g1~~TRINITY_DN3911_c0_g1_i4.p1  ORF type:complete len:224 (-),score=51.28 TRINITY_DN3911_c0_g1_i4:64-735(-)